MIYTVGHSNFSMEQFLELLKQFKVTEIVDVRSAPVSSYTPHFNKVVLEKQLPISGIAYQFMGKEIGGRPSSEEYYDVHGHVLYGKLAGSMAFRLGIGRLLTESEAHLVALMCGEEDPTGCHRHLLIARVLVDAGISVKHIRGDASLETYEYVDERIRAEHPQNSQTDLFSSEREVDSNWISAHSVRLDKRR